MKPEHFKKINPTATCLNCRYIHRIVDQHRDICSKYDFTLPDLVEVYVCRNFKDKSLPNRTPLVEVLGEDTYPRICDELVTLVLKNVSVTSSLIEEGIFDAKALPEFSVDLKGIDRGSEFNISFTATEAFLEEEECREWYK